MDNKFKQFETCVVANLDKDNYTSILKFLSLEVTDYIEDIVNNYLDLFLINCDEFIIKYNKLKRIYGTNFIDLDISLLEHLYTI